MPYKLNKTNGTLLITVQDATVDNSTSLTFLGKNYTGYGPAVEENFLHLLENFASGHDTDQYVPSSPLLSSSQGKPLPGQLWFNTLTNQLNVSPDGLVWKGIASLSVGAHDVVNKDPSIGDLFWDGSFLSLWTGAYYSNIGPFTTATAGTWNFGSIEAVDGSSSPAIIGEINTASMGLQAFTPIVAVSMKTFDTASTSSYHSSFKHVHKGITLFGADPATGSSAVSTSSGYLLWGTAAESLTTKNVNLYPGSTSTIGYIPFSGITSIGTALTTSSSFTYDPLNKVVHATATSAYYADLAERYEADAVYEVGTVLVIGGDKEVTTTDQFADTRVAGIVSKKPAYLMNSEAGNDETHPAIALKGRVPCKVIGYVEKGDLLVTSAHPGYATAAKSVSAGAVVGKALEKNPSGFAVIEVLVV